jgi:uncharacterized protein YdhG (YjbR/CyaY superfamily)
MALRCCIASPRNPCQSASQISVVFRNDAGQNGTGANGDNREVDSVSSVISCRIMKRLPKPVSKQKTFDGYLAALSEDQRAALSKLRKVIRAAAPKAEECISYGIPAFRLNGKFLVGLGAAATHCSFYPGSTVQAYKEDLKGYETSKGTVRFPASKPLPAALVRKIVQTRIANDGFA